MKLKQKIIFSAILVGMCSILTSSVAVFSDASALRCGGIETSVISCGGKDGESKLEKTGVWSILLGAVNILVTGVGVLAVAGVVCGSILYTSAGGNPEQVKKAKSIFTNIAIGVIAFGGMYALLNFIVPGGVFTK